MTIDGTAESDDVSMHPFQLPARLRLRGWVGRLRGQLHPYDAGSSVLLGGAFGLLLVILIDTLVGLRHDSLIRALYDATRTTATISAPELDDEPWVLVWATVAALLVMGFTAAFAAGIVHHLISGRHVALVGRRVMPRSGHVVIAGMGQVGLRLAQELPRLGVAVVGIERFAHAAGLPARPRPRDPRRHRRRVLASGPPPRQPAPRDRPRGRRQRGARQHRGRDLRPGRGGDVTIVIRAGADDAIDETRSLFRIGSVVDVNGLTSVFVVESMLASAPYSVIAVDDRVLAMDATGTSRHAARPAASAAPAPDQETDPPVLRTGVTSDSPHSTTSRLLTMVARRSSSSWTTSCSASWSRAISTMLDGTVTILRLAAITASACWRRSIACAISGA